ncbi:MAG: right-handed parallel beta-helix repeat-containing protein [Bacteroidales bacterium]|nr:right-handed parallel beta-helix repeat-containing protein [Bacteroidales bacterium]MCF8456052.1 right-handed parallel beta-helix repeat-containing protein [Bacteroidales bacterium]
MKSYNMHKIIAILLLLFFQTSVLYAQIPDTYYIDPTNGDDINNDGKMDINGIIHPFASFDAVSWIYGDIYLIKKGEEIQLTNTLEILNSDITIGAYDTGAKPIITSTSSSSQNSIISAYNKQGLTITNIEISSASAAAVGIYFEGTSYNNTIDACEFNSTGKGIDCFSYTVSSQYLTISNCLFETWNYGIFNYRFSQIEIENCEIIGTDIGIYCEGHLLYGCQLTINDCKILGNSDYGIFCDQINDVSIKNSNIEDADMGIKLYNCDFIDIEGCTIFDSNSASQSGNDGIIIYGSADLASITNCKLKVLQKPIEVQNIDEVNIVNCTIYDDGTGSLSDYIDGIYIKNVSQVVLISTCTINRNKTNQNCINIDTDCPNVDISNNILNRDSGTGGSCLKYINNVTADIYNNNCIANTGIVACMNLNGEDENISNNFMEGAEKGIITETAISNIHHNIIKNCTISGIEIGTGTQTDIYHNVVYNESNTSSYTALKVETQTEHTHVYNNIFYLENLTGLVYDFYYCPGIYTNNNMIPADFNDFIKVGSTYHDYLTNYTNCNNNGSNTIQQAPVFVDVDYNDFSLMYGSPGIDVGLTTTTYLLDYAGNDIPASGTATDIGAYEYYPPAEPINWATTELSGWYFATDAIVENYPDHKKGNIYKDGELVNIRGVNWFSIENGKTDLGLDKCDYVELLTLIQEQGFNTIRLVYTADIIMDNINTNSQACEGIVYDSNDFPNNIDFYNTYPGGPKTKYEALQIIINKCYDLGINVLLSHHGIGGNNNGSLWYEFGPYNWSEADYIETLEYVASHFTQSNIIGIDIINEPYEALWNNSSAGNNFKAFVEKAGEAVYAEKPEWLIFAEGIQQHNITALENEEQGLDASVASLNPASAYGPAESLSAVKNYFVNPGKIPTHKIVLSPHTKQWEHDFVQYYISNYESSTITRGQYKAKLKLFNDFRWGGLSDDYALVLGEFAASFHPVYSDSKTWFGPFIEYMGETKLPGSFYASINGNDYEEVEYNGNTENAYFGLLEDDWASLIQDKMDTLARMFGRVKGTAPFTYDLYSPRDGTRYNFPSNSLTTNDVVEHTAHWAGDGDGTQYAYDVLDAINDYGELHDILHAFKVTLNGDLAATAADDFTITVGYTDNELGRVIESSLGFYKYNTSLQEWQEVTSGVTLSVNDDEIELETTAFGIYAVLGTKIKQRTLLPEGWSFWSTYVDPDNSNVENVFSEVINLGYLDDLFILKDGAGGVFWPEYSLNNINSGNGDLTIGEGYQIKMLTERTIYVEGTEVIPETNTLSVPQGWSYLGYLRNNPGAIDQMLSTIPTSHITIVKNGAGHVYWPGLVNTIGHMVPGEGYQINLSVAESLTYPSNVFTSTKSGTPTLSKPVFVYKNYIQELYINTDNNMVVGIPYASWDTPPEPGDEIAAIGENGQLVGKTIFNGGFSAITIFGDDYYTPNVVENLSDEESFTFEVWSATTKTVKSYHFKNWQKGDGFFTKNSIAIVGVEENIEPETTFKINIYPNPGDGKFLLEINSSEICSTLLSVYDISGKQVYYEKLHNDEGNQKIILDLSSFDSGIYTLSLVGKDINKQLKLIIIK